VGQARPTGGMTYQRKDSYHRRAKSEGLRSRAAFKLDDLARGLVRPGDRVVDLGCWPGGWLQVASRIVGAGGRVVGVDLVEIPPLGLANVHTLVGDAADPIVREAIRDELGGPADVVLSDMAPKLTGIRDRDQARAEEVADTAIAIARELLRPGGHFVCKVFMGPGFERLVSELRSSFQTSATRRPDASRKGSSELYLVGRGFRGGDAATASRP
jgi:23S rRNA (uridine2552-2'-O)-methyltransferase